MLRKTAIYLSLMLSVIAQPATATSTERTTDFTFIFIENDPEGAANPSPALMAMISDWLSANFGLPKIDELPRVANASPAQMNALRYRLPAAGTSPEPSSASNTDIVAIYENATRTIYLPDNWTGSSIAEQSVLVHEMVHHLQNVGQIRYACPEERERPAYRAQEAWLARSHSSLEQAFGIDGFSLLVRVNCF
jgi:hypothetical protein